ncbi:MULTISPECIES: DarT ssDNA thymidine ADP-ribosyltransferase family protein [unclassified Methylophilus]|uniref:DarT ssDNA thymidine ADP-ribosyltransferase family protein n=1 Tax=unclassified Methylophilus TaxID=2630143 RepID=UPI0009D9810D|nr:MULTISPECIES: DarT ssDNA thymidine ADP-ribosyltransferase family protein [unclassified Methylophilus]
MPERFVFRQVDYRDLPIFLADGEVRSKNHSNPQVCHQTSYQNLVQRRGTNDFQLPFGGVVNDCVAFYFSPLTSFTCAIHRGRVQVIPPRGGVPTISRLEDRIFLVAKVSDLYGAQLQCCFSDYALNSTVPGPTIVRDPGMLESHIRWELFDENPIAGGIQEIGYVGSCQYFLNKDTPERYQRRGPIRMAEFLIRTAVPMSAFICVVAPNTKQQAIVRDMIQAAGYQLPVFSKPGCFV